MHPRNLLFITILTLCHLKVQAQTLTNAAPPAASETPSAATQAAPAATLPDDPSQQILPVAQPEPAPLPGIPVDWVAQNQSRAGDLWTLDGGVVVHYRNYTLRADKVVYDQSTTQLDAEGHVQVTGGPNDVEIYADRGDLRLNLHTARFFNVHGSQGVRAMGRTTVYSTTNPFFFSGRVLLENGEGHYQIVDGTMTNCRLPHPDWLLYSRSIKVDNGVASSANTLFKFLGVPIFYLPYLHHPIDDTGRESGILIPSAENSSIKGLVLGEQYYWAISRNMDMVAGLEYWSKRGWSPNGDFRYRGPGFDHLVARWDALVDRGVELPTTTGATTTKLTNQGGVDITARGLKYFTPEMHVTSNVEYLSSYVYRLVFNDNYAQATNSEVISELSWTLAHNGFIPSVAFSRFQSFAGSTSSQSNSTYSDEVTINGNQAKILRLPNLHFDVLDQPLSRSWLYAGMNSSLGYLNRSEPDFHARNVGRIDFYPHLSLPLSAGGWNFVPEIAFRETAYTKSQNIHRFSDTPTTSRDPLNRTDLEASVLLRAPAVERDFVLSHGDRILRHVIEPELTYRYVGGIGSQARHTLLVDTTDIATDTNEIGYSLTQRLYLRPAAATPCAANPAKNCPVQPREWASWQIAQKIYLNDDFGGALVNDRRNVFASTLDLSAVSFLTSPRNLAPVTSRLRFEAIQNLRFEWDLDFDPKTGRMDSDNLYAGYSWGNTTVGVGHAMLNAADESNGRASTIKSQQLQPFLAIGKQSGKGFNLAANGGYDFLLGQTQYWGAQAVYNWDCCGLTFGYRRFDLGAYRGNDSQWLGSFTLANFGSVGDINRSKSVFRDPTLPPAY
jgi:LPS-assembly protein